MASPSYLALYSQVGAAALARKQRYRRLIGMAFGATGLAAALVGMPLEFSLGVWGLGSLAWAYLKAVWARSTRPGPGCFYLVMCRKPLAIAARRRDHSA